MRRTYDDPSTPPQRRIFDGDQSKHVLEAFDDVINRRVRPEGVVAAEIYRRIDGDVHDFDGDEPIAAMSRRRATIRYAATDHGRVAHYRGRPVPNPAPSTPPPPVARLARAGTRPTPILSVP